MFFFIDTYDGGAYIREAYYYRTGKNNKRIPLEIDMVCVI